MKLIIGFLSISIILLWVRVLHLEDGMNKADKSVKLIAGGLMEVKSLCGR